MRTTSESFDEIDSAASSTNTRRPHSTHPIFGTHRVEGITGQACRILPRSTQQSRPITLGELLFGASGPLPWPQRPCPHYVSSHIHDYDAVASSSDRRIRISDDTVGQPEKIKSRSTVALIDAKVWLSYVPARKAT